MPTQLDPEEVSTVAKHLFGLFAKENQIAPDDYPSLSPVPFLEWLKGTSLTELEVAAQLGVAQEAARYVMSMAFDPTGPNRLIPMWPYITLAMRPMRHELKSMQLFLVLTWVDGTVCPLSIYLHKDILEDGVLNDASVCSTVTSHSHNLTSEVLDKGLDAIHDDRQINGLFGAERIVQLAQDLVNGVVDRKVVPDSDMAAVNQLMLFMATMFPNRIPQELLDQIAARKAAQVQTEKASDGFEGGFDG